MWSNKIQKETFRFRCFLLLISALLAAGKAPTLLAAEAGPGCTLYPIGKTTDYSLFGFPKNGKLTWNGDFVTWWDEENKKMEVMNTVTFRSFELKMKRPSYPTGEMTVDPTPIFSKDGKYILLKSRIQRADRPAIDPKERSYKIDPLAEDAYFMVFDTEQKGISHEPYRTAQIRGRNGDAFFSENGRELITLNTDPVFRLGEKRERPESNKSAPPLEGGEFPIRKIQITHLENLESKSYRLYQSDQTSYDARDSEQFQILPNGLIAYFEITRGFNIKTSGTQTVRIRPLNSASFSKDDFKPLNVGGIYKSEEEESNKAAQEKLRKNYLEGGKIVSTLQFPKRWGDDLTRMPFFVPSPDGSKILIHHYGRYVVFDPGSGKSEIYDADNSPYRDVKYFQSTKSSEGKSALRMLGLESNGTIRIQEVYPGEKGEVWIPVHEVKLEAGLKRATSSPDQKILAGFVPAGKNLPGRIEFFDMPILTKTVMDRRMKDFEKDSKTNDPHGIEAEKLLRASWSLPVEKEPDSIHFSTDGKNLHLVYGDKVTRYSLETTCASPDTSLLSTASNHCPDLGAISPLDVKVQQSFIKLLEKSAALCEQPIETEEQKKAWDSILSPGDEAVQYLIRFQKPGGFEPNKHLAILLAILKSPLARQKQFLIRGALENVLATSDMLYEALAQNPEFKEFIEKTMSEFDSPTDCRTPAEIEKLQAAQKEYANRVKQRRSY